MKTNKSIYLLLFCFVLTSFANAQSKEPAENDWEISLGKRKNNLLSRKIQEINLGNTFTSYNPVFFKIKETGKWQKVGLRGAHIRPYIPSNDFSEDHFQAFRKKKTASYWCLGVATTSYLGWAFVSLDYAIQNNTSSIKMFFNPRSLAFLVGAIGTYAWGASMNAQGDLELFLAFNSDKVKQEKEELSLHLGLTRSGGLGLDLTF